MSKPTKSKAKYLVEICPHEPRATICGPRDGVDSLQRDTTVIDCVKSGDCAQACHYLLSQGVEFRIVARDTRNNYRNRLATHAEIVATARAIYGDYFASVKMAKVYLVWDACAQRA